MFLPDASFIDLHVISTIFYKNIWYLIKLLLVAYVVFYYTPSKIFPQEHIKSGMQKIVFNFVYMTAYIEIVVPFLIFIKIFSLLLFILVIIATKFSFMHFYYKRDIFKIMNDLRINLMLKVLNILDKPNEFKQNLLKYFHENLITFQRSITLNTFLKNILFYAIFIYIFSTLMLRGMLSYSDPVLDTAQFMEWVGYLQENILYADNKTFGADFYGISILIFFVNIFTNIDQIILFSLYPILLLLALYFSIYYIIKDITSSSYTALFAVMVHGMILMTPLSDVLLGEIVVTAHPHLVNFYGLKFYMPTSLDVLKNGNNIGFTPYIRYISGMAYEHASIFVFLNAHFLIKTLETKFTKYFVMYTLTLMLVFIFHGGGAIILIFISILIAINGALFRKIDLKLLKKGILAILSAAIFGNLWILSMLKYGIPQDFGAAAPMLDKLMGTQKNIQNIAATGFSEVSIINITQFQLFLLISLFFAFIVSFFSKKKFINSSYLLIVFAIFMLYFGPNAGLPLLAKQDRLAEYIFYAITILSAFYFFYFIYKPILLVFKKYSKSVFLLLFYTLFVILSLGLTIWADTNIFWKNINQTQYTSIPQIILRINKQNRPFTWTAVAYVQSYAKIKNKGYHINSQNFILRYKPNAEFLTIPTGKIFIFVENYPNSYKGMDEWFYRWRNRIQSNMKSWIAIYTMNHNNIKIYAQTKTVTAYEIDNNEYMKYLSKGKAK